MILKAAREKQSYTRKTPYDCQLIFQQKIYRLGASEYIFKVLERKNYNQEYPTVGWDSELKERDFPRHAKTEGFHDD